MVEECVIGVKIQMRNQILKVRWSELCPLFISYVSNTHTCHSVKLKHTRCSYASKKVHPLKKTI